jgi:replicative DNA helicase
MSVAAQSYFAALIQASDLKTYLSHGRIKHLFRSELDSKLFDFVDFHAREYGKLPDIQTVLTHGKTELPETVEPADYYLDLLRKAYVEVAIREAAALASKYLTGDEKNPLAALDVMRSGVSSIDAHNMTQAVIDYRDAGALLLERYKKTLTKDESTGLKFGWPTLDAMTGGLEDGDVISIAGRPGQGKTWFMLWIAINSWRQGVVPLFVSMEIKPEPILQRISALHLEVSAASLKYGTLTSKTQPKYINGLKNLGSLPYPFWVVDGNLNAQVSDIEALALQLKPGLIGIDGAYLLKHPYERDRYKRVADNMDLIKQRLAPIAPTAASWQFSREAKKLKKGEEPSLDHIGYSDTIGQHSSLVLGVFDHDEEDEEERKKISILKGRNGEAGAFYVKWQFVGKTNFSEVEPEKLEDMAF